MVWYLNFSTTMIQCHPEVSRLSYDLTTGIVFSTRSAVPDTQRFRSQIHNGLKAIFDPIKVNPQELHSRQQTPPHSSNPLLTKHRLGE